MADRVLLRGAAPPLVSVFRSATEDRVVAEAVVPGLRLAHQPAGHLPPRPRPVALPVGQRAPRHRRTLAPRRPSGTSTIWSSSSRKFAASSPVPAGPAGGEHARHAVQRVSHASPESSATLISPVARAPTRAFVRRVRRAKVAAVLRYPSYGAASSRPITRRSGCTSASDAPQLGEFVGIAGGEQHLTWASRRQHVGLDLGRIASSR